MVESGFHKDCGYKHRLKNTLYCVFNIVYNTLSYTNMT